LTPSVRVEVYNSYMLNDCPLDVWATLDADAVASQHGADMAVLNGPRYWMMDGIGKIDNVQPELAEFGGLLMRKAATIDVDPTSARVPYTLRTVHRGAVFFFDAGKEVFEIVTDTSATFVLQAYCTSVDSSMSVDTLATLGSRLALPEGWRFRARVLDDELRVDTTGEPATVFQDEFENTYTMVR
jgi:hypothetical protein